MSRDRNFDAIKDKAKEVLSHQVESATFYPGPRAAEALVHISLNDSFPQERQALIEFAQAYHSSRKGDVVASMATTTRDRPTRDLHLIALRAREEANQLIDRWDARSVARLIDLFPEVVPNACRACAVSCYVADDEDSTWMIEFDISKPRAPSILQAEALSTRVVTEDAEAVEDEGCAPTA